MAKSLRSKTTDISQRTKQTVWERDNHRCIFCGSPSAMPNAHVISRSKGGLGVEQNVVTACINCHHKMDQTIDRELYLKTANKYLDNVYPNRKYEDLIYKK